MVKRATTDQTETIKYICAPKYLKSKGARVQSFDSQKKIIRLPDYPDHEGTIFHRSCVR